MVVITSNCPPSPASSPVGGKLQLYGAPPLQGAVPLATEILTVDTSPAGFITP